MVAADLLELIDYQRKERSLEPPPYLSQEVLALERRGRLAEQLYGRGYSSEVSEPSSYIVRELLVEPLIGARDTGGALHGL